MQNSEHPQVHTLEEVQGDWLPICTARGAPGAPLASFGIFLPKSNALVASSGNRIDQELVRRTHHPSISAIFSQHEECTVG